MNSKYPNKYVFSSLKQKNINWRVFWACYFNTKGHLFNIYWLITSKSPRSSKPPRTPADKQSHFGLMHRKYNFTLVATPVCSPINPASFFIHLIREIINAQQQHGPVAPQSRSALVFLSFHFTGPLSENTLKGIPRLFFFCTTVRLHKTIYDSWVQSAPIT